MKDKDRIGLIFSYKGDFMLHKTDDIFKYMPWGRITKVSVVKEFSKNPMIQLDEKGTYLGNNIFMIKNGDQFKQKSH